jgi:hypothetical protein
MRGRIPATLRRPRTLRGSGALVLGDFRQSLAVGRSLRAAGYRVIAGRGTKRTIFERSNSVAEVWEHPPYSKPLAWEEALEAFCQARPDVGLVFPVEDADSRDWRTDCPDGTGLCIEGESVPPSPALLRWTEALVARLGYTGAGCAQFMVDERDGTAGFLEINTRLGGDSAAACACGLDLPRLFVETVLGVAEAQPPAKTGRRYPWLSGDLNGLASSMRSYGLGTAAVAGWLGRTALAQLRSRDNITWSWRDPLPALAVFAPIIPAAGRRALKLLTHRLKPSYMPSLG